MMQLLLLPLTVIVSALVTARAHTIPSGLAYKGVSLAGPEYAISAWADGNVPGKFGTSYKWPHPSYGYYGIDYFVNKEMTIFRVPFRWERIQPTRGAPLDPTELDRMITTVRGLTARNVHVHLDLHNYMRYHLPGQSRSNDIGIVGQGAVTISHFADVWRRLASEFKDDTRIIFALNNEPHNLDMSIYYKAIQAAIDAIRDTGAKNYIAVMGGHYGGVLWYYPQTNANTMLSKINDPNGNILWDAHLYMNSDSSGSTGDCVNETVAVERATRFTNWLIANKQIGIISEFGAGVSSTCSKATDNLLKHMEANSAHYAGWIWWDAGPGPMGWADRFKVEPAGGQDVTQMNVLEPHIKWQPPKVVVDVVTAPAVSTCSKKLYGQCGGKYFGGNTCCPLGLYCKYANDNWSDCQVGSAVVVAPGGTVNQVVTCKNVAFSRCGGKNYTGATCCPSGYSCLYVNQWWSDCKKKVTTSTATSTCTTAAYAQCDGKNFTGTKCCKTGYYCKVANTYWSYCAKSTTGFDEANPSASASLTSSSSNSMFDEAKAIEAAEAAEVAAAISATEGINLSSSSSYGHHSMSSSQPQ